MARESVSMIGSGTTPYTYGILSPANRGSYTGPASDAGKGERIGTNINVVNFEDGNSVDAFAVSGITVTTTPTKIWDANINPLARQRTIEFINMGPSTANLFNAGSSLVSPSGFALTSITSKDTTSRIKLPLMKNVEVWAVAETGFSQIRILAY